jgi:hypothetical protein
MAIYHLTTKPVSRAKGHSATAGIAYRAAERVHDLSTDEVFDYTRKQGVEHAEIVLPSRAAQADINWARDRQTLWNAAETAEKRRDARVAREYELALPHELKREQRVELVRAFSADLANRYGVAVDFAIHAPHRHGDERNFHAHVFTTTREITPTGLGAKTEIELGDRDRAQRGLGPAKLEIKAIRARWAELTNEHLLEQGIEARVDHRTLRAQGIEREPTTHLGPAVWGLERRGIETEVGARVREQQRQERELQLERSAELERLERAGQGLERSILDLSGDLAAAKRQRLGQEREVGLEGPSRQEVKPDPFEGLTLGKGRGERVREQLAEVRLGPPEVALERELGPGGSVLAVGAQRHRAVEQYARAWTDLARMREQELPVLEHQKLAIEKAGTDLERVHPGATRTLQRALEYEPSMQQAMRQLQGKERSLQLLAGIEREERIQADPNQKAERLVKVWKELEHQREQFQGFNLKPQRDQVEARMRSLITEVKQDRQLETVLRTRQQEFGIEFGSRMDQFVRARTLKRALSLGIEGPERGLHLER